MNAGHIVIAVIIAMVAGCLLAVLLNSGNTRTASEIEADDEEQITQITAWRIEQLNKAAAKRAKK